MNSSQSATAPSVTIPAVDRYAIDTARSTITFHTRHMFGLGRVNGSFSLYNGEIEVADPLTHSTAWAEVSAESFRTGNSSRDGAVRSAKYLDTANHPSIRFVSRELAQIDGQWTLGGTLTVREVERPVWLVIEHCRVSGGELTVRAVTSIDRFEFEITAQRGMTGRHLDLVLDLVATPSP